ncbi:MAG: VWA domain-containing protein [Sandaracinaceae bacterium]|nr:VWA domain-containing protein [Sandaracinaceae bacterium]
MKRWQEAFLLLGWACVLGVFALYLASEILGSELEGPLDLQTFRFERPWAGLLGLGVLISALAHLAWRRARPRFAISRAQDLARVARPRWKQWLSPLPMSARLVALALCTIALMGPQSIYAREEAEVEGIDMVLVLDCSLSMQASDIHPNRFIAMKDVVDEFIARRQNDRIGAVIFGVDAYTLLPLTTDKEALRNVIAELELGNIDGQGTAIGNALGVALNRLRYSQAKSRVIILLTDGDSNAGNLSPDQATEIAAAMGVRIYTVLMGQADEAPYQKGSDAMGRPIWDRGEFPINPTLMRRIAERTGGQAFVASNRSALERSFHAILDSLERSKIEDPGRIYADLHAPFLWPALGLLLFEVLFQVLYLRRWP